MTINPTTSALRPGTKVLVVGLGKTGLSCARYLHARGCTVAVTDSREAPPGLDRMRAELPDVALMLDGFSDAAFDAAEQIVVSPGVPLAEPPIQRALAAGIPVLGDVELFARVAQAPVVGITGSNGKSTVTTLLGLMAHQAGRRVAVGGNLGDPVLEILADDVDLYVVELSSFQLETTHSLRLRAATVLNLSPDHMDRYPSMAAYACAKQRIFAHADSAVVNRDDALAAGLADGVAHCIGFRLGVPLEAGDYGVADHRGARWIMRCSVADPQPLMPVAELLASRYAQSRQRACRPGPGRSMRPGTGADVRRPADLPWARASQRIGGRAQRRALDQRFQGHESRSDGCSAEGTGAGVEPGQGGVDRWR
jgi:UDP-N-acetylmuramoylalanine-D-glutamate ligase